MQVGFSYIIQVYSSWGCGILPLTIIWILCLNNKLSYYVPNIVDKNFSSNYTKSIIIIFLGLILSISPVRELVVIQNNQSAFMLSKLNITFCWFFGILINSLLSIKNNRYSVTQPTTTCSLFSLVYIWQIACSIGHPIVLLICLEINLLLFLVICVEDTFSESILINIIILLWIGALASVFALLGLKGIGSGSDIFNINLLWVIVLLLKFILIPAQVTLFGIYQRWTNFNLVVYLSCYYLPVLYLLTPMLIILTTLGGVVSLIITLVICLTLCNLITQYESTSTPNKTIAFSSLITLVLLLIAVLV